MEAAEHIAEAEKFIARAQEHSGENALTLSNIAVAHSNLAAAKALEANRSVTV